LKEEVTTGNKTGCKHHSRRHLAGSTHESQNYRGLTLVPFRLDSPKTTLGGGGTHVATTWGSAAPDP